MRLRVESCLALMLVLLTGVALWGDRRINRAYEWTAADGLLTPRAGACAVALPDGRVLISGGEGPQGPLAGAEILRLSGTIAAAEPMASGRSGHVCVALGDGRVLVAGGVAATGAATNAAEVFDPRSGSWTTVGPMRAARAAATASLLPSGRVVVAGGEASGAALASIDIFDSAGNAFYAGPSILSSPRSRHAAAVLRDGRVLLAGGSNGERAIDTVDVFDPMTESVSTLGKLSVPREGLSAVTLLDGRVYFAGGRNATGLLGSAELWDPIAGFSPAAPMSVARAGHAAIRIPRNNAVLLVGGDPEGALSSAELYIPWTNSYRPLSRASIGRTGAAVAAPADGRVIAAGGVSGPVRAQAVSTITVPTISTDKADYQPGDQVTIIGANWMPGEAITFNISRAPSPRTLTLTFAADGAGSFVYKAAELVMTSADVNQTYTINAMGTLGSTAQAITFTDANPQTLTLGFQSPASINPGLTAQFQLTLVVGGKTDPCTVTFSVDFAAPAPAGVTPNTPSPVTTTGANIVQNLTVATTAGTAGGAYPFTVTAIRGSNCQGNGNLTASGTLQVAGQSTTTAVTSSANPSVFGQSVTFTATVAPAVSGVPTGTVTFKDGATTLGTGALSGGVATFSTSSLSVAAHSITASYGGDASFNASVSPALTQTVNKANTTTNVTSSANPSVFGQSVMLTATVAAQAPGAGSLTGSVVFTIDGTPQSPVALGGGTATFTSSSLGVGGHTVSAAYSGDGNFNGSSGSLSQTVNPANTATAITTHNPDPSVVGQSVAIAFTVSAVAPGAGAPTGNVTVSDGPNTCTATVAAGACSLTFTTTGSRTLTATYAGDSNFNGSSGTTSHTVNPASTTTTITSDNPDPSVVGQSVTVSYTVTVNSPGAGTPTGNVTVSDGPNTCTATVAAGSCPLTLTAAGSHNLTATYAGDSKFSGSASAAAAHTVNKADTTTAITTHTPDPSVVGQGVTVNFSVTASAPGAGTPSGNVTVGDGVVSCTATVAAGACSLTFTTAGAKTLSATYAGDSNFNASASAGAAHTVNKAPTATALVSSVNPSVFGQSVTFTATVSVTPPGAGSPTGTVTFTIDGTPQAPVALSGASAAYTTTTLSVSGHNISAAYNADANFSASTGTLTQTVNKADTATTIGVVTPEPSVTGQSYEVNFSVAAVGPGAGTPTGNVTVSDGTASCTNTVAVGKCSLASASAGAKTVTATYSGDSNFNGSNGSKAHQVNKANTVTTIVTIAPSPSVTGQAVTVSFSVSADAPGSGTPTGNVTVSDGAISCTGTVAAGSCSLTFATAGARTLTATYAGDANYNLSASAGAPHTVNKAATTTAVTSSANPSVFGQSVTFTATVTVNSPGTGTPTGGVIFSIDGTPQPSVPLTGNTATFATSALSVTGHSISAAYSGDANFIDSTGSLTQTVNKANTLTTIVSVLPEPSVTGQTYEVTFTVTPVSPGSGSPSGNVTVTDGGLGTCSAMVAVGKCSLSSASAGAKTLTAAYSGNDSFNGGSGTKAHQVNPANTTTAITTHNPDPSVVGQSVTVSFTVSAAAPGAGTPSGNVTVTAGADTCSATVAAGSCSIIFTTAGNKTLTATYAGDANFNGSTSGGAPHTVNRAATTTGITSSVNPSVFGQSVTFTASVTVNSPGTGTPTGSVIFSLDGTPQLPSVPLTGGAAAFTTSALSVAGHSISAAYSGDANFIDSAGSLSQTVNKADSATTIGVVTPEPSVTGQSYEVNFSVAAVAPGAGTPAGNVTVSDGTASCSATIAVGKCALANSSAGAKTLTATYAGDSNFKTSSGTKAHQVDKASTTTAITLLSPSPSVTGQGVTVTFTVAVNSPGSGTPTGNVTVSAGTDTCTGTVAAGTCSLTFATAGNKTLTATYAGDSNFNGSSGTKGHTVNPAQTATTVVSSPNPSVFGQGVVFTAAVSAVSPGAGTPNGGTVTFKEGAVTVAGPVSVSGGAAVSGPVTSLAVGSHTITAEYSGYADYLGSSGSVGQTVNKRAVLVSVVVTPGSASEGGSGTVAVSVTDNSDPASNSTPTGTVTLAPPASVTVGGACVLAQTILGSAACVVPLTFLDNGSPSIAAAYSGSAVHLAGNGAGGASVANVPPAIQSVVSPPDPYAVGTPVPVTISFSDPGVLDTFTCAVTWDDNVTGPTTSVAASAVNPKSCVVNRSFSAAGVYSFTAKVTDKDGGEATLPSVAYVVVYDPTGGFVTGGGWITSPVGAYAANPSLTGKANFGFVSKYQKGANVPSGDTEFQFQAASFNFKSVSYEWLVVAGAKAQYKGAGTINGAGGYSFMLTAIDGSVNGGGGSDKFRLKVWNTATNVVVYDNQVGADENATPTTQLGGGSIVVHSPK